MYSYNNIHITKKISVILIKLASYKHYYIMLYKAVNFIAMKYWHQTVWV